MIEDGPSYAVTDALWAIASVALLVGGGVGFVYYSEYIIGGGLTVAGVAAICVGVSRNELD